MPCRHTHTHTHTHTHSPHLYNPPPCSALGCAPVSIRGQELIGGPGAFPRWAGCCSASPGEARQIRDRAMLSIQLLLILLQGTFVFLITGKHAFWICRESEDGARRTSAYRNTWRSDRPRAEFGHNLRWATEGLQTLICGIVCTFSWRLWVQNTVCYSRFPHKHTCGTSLRGNPGYYDGRFVFVWPSLRNVELRDRQDVSEKLPMVLSLYGICYGWKN